MFDYQYVKFISMLKVIGNQGFKNVVPCRGSLVSVELSILLLRVSGYRHHPPIGGPFLESFRI